MIIPIRGDWKEHTLAKQVEQIHTIWQKMTTYKVTLGIQTSAIDRVGKADAMLQYIVDVEKNVDGYNQGLTAYRHQLLDGNKLQMMNPFPDMTPFAVAPPADLAGVWHFIESQRTIYMENDAWTDTIGEDMHLLGPLTKFDTDTYTPELKIKIFPGIIEVHTDSAIIPDHKLYVGASGTSPLPFISDFKGKVYKYGRPLANGPAEKLDVMLRGLWNNTIVGQDSPVLTIAYKG